MGRADRRPQPKRGGTRCYSSKVSAACGQQLDWRGVRHTRESCGGADPRGHLRESYAPSSPIKSTSDLDRHHVCRGIISSTTTRWRLFEPPTTISGYGHFDSDDYSIHYSTPWGSPTSSSIRCGQQLDWRGFSHTRECEPADTKCRHPQPSGACFWSSQVTSGCGLHAALYGDICAPLMNRAATPSTGL